MEQDRNDLPPDIRGIIEALEKKEQGLSTLVLVFESLKQYAQKQQEPQEVINEHRNDAEQTAIVLGVVKAMTKAASEKLTSPNDAQVLNDSQEPNYSSIEIEELEKIPIEVMTELVSKHRLLGAVLNKAIDNKSLALEYRLPEMSFFAADIINLIPVFIAAQEMELEPEFIFVPQNLTIEQWSNLLNNLSSITNNRNLENGITVTNNFEVPIDRFQNDKLENNHWKLSVITSSPLTVQGNQAIVTKLCRDGLNLPDRENIAELTKFFTNQEYAANLAPSIKQTDTRFDDYLSLQLLRLLNHQEPIDSIHWTIGEMRQDDQGQVIVSLYKWSKIHHAISLNYVYWDYLSTEGVGGNLRLSCQARS